MIFNWKVAFWTLLSSLCLVAGGVSIWLGFFVVHRLPLGVTGILLALLAVYVLIIKWRDLSRERRDRFDLFPR